MNHPIANVVTKNDGVKEYTPIETAQVLGGIALMFYTLAKIGKFFEELDKKDNELNTPQTRLKKKLMKKHYSSPEMKAFYERIEDRTPPSKGSIASYRTNIRKGRTFRKLKKSKKRYK